MSNLISLSDDSIVALTAFAAPADIGRLLKSCTSLLRSTAHPAIWKREFGRLGEKIDKKDASESEDWKLRFCEKLMLKAGGRCCLCYVATQNAMFSNFKLRLCHMCVSGQFINKTKAKAGALLSDKDISELSFKSQSE